jgi:predicted ATPase
VIIGREADCIRAAAVSAAEGTGQCVLLVGEPRIGKSRLAREAVGWATARGMQALGGRAVPASGSAA